MNPGAPSNATRNEKVFRSLGYGLVFLTMACVVMTIGAVIRSLVPGWHSGILASIMLFIVIDRLYTYQHLKSLAPLSSEWALAFGAQWVLIILLIRILLSYANGMDSFREDILLFSRGHLLELFTLEFVAGLLLALLVWYITGQFMDLLDEIGLDQARALQDASMPIQTEAVPAHQRLVNLVFSLGIGLVILTALARVDLGTIASNADGLPTLEFSRLSGGEAGALLYFVFGLALLSLSRLMSLQTHWNRLHIPVSSQNLYRQWGMYSLFFLLALAVLVSLLPAGDSLGFFSVLGTLFDFLISILFFIGQVIFSLIFLLFSLPFMLMGQDAPISNPPLAPPPLPNLPVQPQAPATSSAVWALVRSILLWGSLLAILVFAFIHFVRQHGGLRAALRNSRVTNWLILAWQWLYKNVEKTGGDLSRAIAAGWQSLVSQLEGKRILPRPGWLNLRSLDPRRQVYFFYLAMVRRGEEQGLRRKPSQTPSEYAATLEQALPSAGEDIDALTAAFVEARYSRQAVDRGKAQLVKATWERIRRALRDKSRNEKFEKK